MINTLLQSNQIRQAIAVLEPTLSAEQNDPQLFALAGETYMRSGDFTKATEFYEKANELAPNSAAIHTALGLSKLAPGDREHGIAELELAQDLDRHSPRAGILLTLAHLRANAFDKALATIDELIQEDAKNPLFYNLKGAVFVGKNDAIKARENFNQALSIEPNYFPAVTNLARLDMQDQKPDIAKGRFEAILKSDDKNVQAMSALANLALAQGNTAEATRWLERASNQNPNELEPALQLTAHYLRIDDMEKALLLARKLNGTYPNEPRVLEVLGRVQMAQDNLSAALDTFERLAGRLPDSALAQLQIANVHSMMKNYTAASTALRKALFIDPGFVEAKVALVRLAIFEDKPNDAMSLAQSIQKDHANIPQGYELEGDLWMREKKPDAAVKAYEKAFTVAQNGVLVTKIHGALSQAGNDKKAHAEITQWLAKNPDDAATRLFLANEYLGKKQYANAAKEYETIVQKNPQHVMSLNNLAWIYQQSKDSRALEYAEKAFQLSSENPAIQDTLGWILVDKGEIDRALPILEKAASQLPDNATIQYHYAHALAKAGNQAQARQILGKITAGNIDFPEIGAARELLKQVQ
jgi:putative PEP-CTERM system TPR-repeat lipoprotein